MIIREKDSLKEISVRNIRIRFVFARRISNSKFQRYNNEPRKLFVSPLFSNLLLSSTHIVATIFL